MLKRISALLTALVLSTAVFCGCSSSDKNNSSSSSSSQDTTSESTPEESVADTPSSSVPEPSLTIDGEKIDTENLVMLTIDGRDVSFDEFRYYYYNTLQALSQSYGTTLETLAQTENGYDTLLERVVTNIKQDYVAYKLCEENGLELTDDDKAVYDEIYENFRSNAASDEEYQIVLAEAYMTDELFKKMIELATLRVKVEDELFTNEGPYATSKDAFREIVVDPAKYACVRSILIPYCCKAEITDSETAAAYDSYSLNGKFNAKTAAYEALSEEEKNSVKEEAKALAEEVLAKANAGDDFEELLAEYGWDPGMEASPEGYYMTPETSFVQEFLDGAFALAEGEISPLVENSYYGWFIIKRMPIDMDYVEENIDSMITEYDTASIQQLYIDKMEQMDITYSDIFNKLTIDSIT